MDPFIEKAKADLVEIDKHIGVLRAKKKKLQDFLSIYDELPAVAKDVFRPEPDRNLSFPSLDMRLAPTGGTNTAKARITNAVAQILADGRPRHTRGLLDILALQGLAPGAADKIIGLSNLLSRDDRFAANRSIGWTLKK